MSINNQHSLSVDDIFATLDDDGSSKNMTNKRKSMNPLSPLAPKKLKSLIGITSGGMGFDDDDFDMHDFEEEDDDQDEGELYEFNGNENPSLTKGFRRTRQSRTYIPI